MGDSASRAQSGRAQDDASDAAPPLLSLSGGQQLLQGEMGGGMHAALLFDIGQLAMRPSVLWTEGVPDALCAVPPLLLAFRSATRTLSTYQVATGELLRTCVLPRPLPPRVLVRTYRQHPGDRWDPGLAGLDPALVERLADLGVTLVGIDTASIDPASSKDLPSHQAVRRRGLRVLENLVLDAVPEGDYELIALPLKLMQADASPVRAVLRALPTTATPTEDR